MSSAFSKIPSESASVPRRKLDSWKEIAGYLGRDVRTVQRWEKTSGLAVRRLYHEQRGSVYAFTDELDAWVASREPEAPRPAILLPAPPQHFRGMLAACAIGSAALALFLLVQKIASPRRDAIASSAKILPMTSAREAYLRGLYLLDLGTREGLTKSIAAFEEAATRNPRFAAGYAGIADAQTYLSSGKDRASHLAAAREASARALSIDATSAEAHESAAVIATYADWNWPLAEAEYKRALGLDPDLATAHSNYAQLAAILGREELAVSEAQRAWQLQPLSPSLGASLGWYYYWARQYDRAIATSREVLQSQPGFFSAQSCIVRALIAQGKFSEAREAVIRQMQDNKIDFHAAGLDAPTPEQAIHNYFVWRLGRLKEMEKSGEFPSFDLALTYAGLGDAPGLVECMEKSFERRQFIVLLINVEPFFDRYRMEPQLVELAQKIGLPAAQPAPATVASLR